MKSRFMILMSLLALTSCVPALVCIGGGLGTISVRNRKGVSGTVSDNVIHGNVLSELSKASLFKMLEVSVKHSRVMLLGYVLDEDQKKRAIEIASQARGVTEVIDEIKIGYSSTFEHSIVDSTVTSRIKTAMMFDGNVHCLNFNITTYNGVVYILGSAESNLEKDVVVNIARTTCGVNKVIAYINVLSNISKKK